MDWLEGLGIHFMAIAGIGASYLTWHLIGDEGGLSVGRGLITPMESIAKELGVDIRTNAPMTDLFVEDGVVKGAYLDDDGVEKLVAAKAVILATGGYASNAEMFEEFTHVPYDSVFVWGMNGRDGDGIRLARSLGAALHKPNSVMFSGVRVRDTNSFYDCLNALFVWQPNLRVNENAERYVDESSVLDFSGIGNAATGQVSNFSIFDQAYLDQIAQVEPYISMDNYGYPAGVPISSAYDEIAASENVVKADTIEELAELLGLNAAALRATVDEYNSACAAGNDTKYGKAPMFLQPVQTAPFYGTKLQPTVYTTVGGIKVNSEMSVIAADGSVVESLYAIGGDAGGIYGNDYDVSIMSGSQQGWAATSGRLAAESAAR